MNDQESYWKSSKGAAYHQRWDLEPDELDVLWRNTLAGMKRSELNRDFLALCPEAKTLLDVGCGVGNQLAMLKRDTDLECRGMEICPEAVERARERGFEVMEGRIGDEVEGTDIIMTSGVLSHLPPLAFLEAIPWLKNLGRWIWGWEYSADSLRLKHRKGQMEYLWHGPYCDLIANGWRILKRERTKGAGEMFLLEKPE